MTSFNGLICFTNCLLPQEDGTLLKKDLWIDEQSGVVLDAQKTFFYKRQRPDRIINLSGNVLSPGLIDTQINGAYNVDFSVFNGDEAAYLRGIEEVSRRIVETGVTALVPTIITQSAPLYPSLLALLHPARSVSTESSPTGAHILGWHAEGPFLQPAKRGAHAPPLLQKAQDGHGWDIISKLYGPGNLAPKKEWLTAGYDTTAAVNETKKPVAVRIITAAPELDGIMETVSELSRRGIVVSIGHSTAPTAVATQAVRQGARLITHLFNAMPQLHHRDPGIIGLLGASPHCSSMTVPTSLPPTVPSTPRRVNGHNRITSLSGINGGPPEVTGVITSEALEEPPDTPAPNGFQGRSGWEVEVTELLFERGLDFERPYYELIVDGVHSHPNSVRLAYSSFPEGCILITDAMKILDPHLADGVHEWRDGKRFVKEGDRLYLEGSDTLAGSVVTLDKCVRNFVRFTGCSLGQAIKCATFNPARCLRIEDRKGTLRPGADADLVVIDPATGRVLSTWIMGHEVWSREKGHLVHK